MILNNFTYFSALYIWIFRSLFFFFGICFPLNPIAVAIPLSLFSFLLQKANLKSFIYLLCIFCFGLIYGSYTKQKQPKTPLHDTFYFKPSTISKQFSHFGQYEVLTGIISNQNSIKNVAVYLEYSSLQRPTLSSHFWIKGTFSPKKNLPCLSVDEWTPVIHTWALTEYRFQIKQKLSKSLYSLFKRKQVANLASTLILGTSADRVLSFEFGQVGLQHLLAISGFHFGLLSWLFGLLFSKIFNPKIAILLLLLFLLCYFLLIGDSPSVLRAYLAISLYLLGRLGKIRTNPLNLLGLVFFLELLLYPENIYNKGFHLSFLATFSILFFLTPISRIAEKLLPNRSIFALQKSPLHDRLIYFFAIFIRNAVSLNLAVHMGIVPLCLFYFQSFPIMGFLYNLILPPLISAGLFGICISSMLFWVPFLGSWISQITEWILGTCVDLVLQSPSFLHLQIHMKYISLPLLSILLTGTFLLFITRLESSFQARVRKKIFSNS